MTTRATTLPPSRSEVLNAIDAVLKPHGFKKKSKGVFVAQLSEDITAYLWLDLRPAQLFTKVSPLIGFTPHPVMATLDRMKIKIDTYPERFRSPLPYIKWVARLVPDSVAKKYSGLLAQQWDLEGGAKGRKQLRTLLYALETYLVPFVRKNATLKTLMKNAHDGKCSGFFYSHEFATPVGLHLLGRNKDVFNYVKRVLKGWYISDLGLYKWREDWRGDSGNPYRTFVRRLLAEMKKAGWRPTAKQMAELKPLLRAQKMQPT